MPKHKGLQANQVGIFAGNDGTTDFTFSLEEYFRQPRFSEAAKVGFAIPTGGKNSTLLEFPSAKLTTDLSLHFGEIIAGVEVDLTASASIIKLPVSTTMATSSLGTDVTNTLSVAGNKGYLIDENGNNVIVPGTMDKVYFYLTTDGANGDVSSATNTKISFVSSSGVNGAEELYNLPEGNYFAVATTSWNIGTAARYNIVGRSPYAKDESYEEIAEAIAGKPKSWVFLELDAHTELNGTDVLAIECDASDVWTLKLGTTVLATTNDVNLPIGTTIEPNGFTVKFNGVPVNERDMSLTVASNVQTITLNYNNFMAGAIKSLYDGADFELVWK